MMNKMLLTVCGLTLALATAPAWGRRCHVVPPWFLTSGVIRGDMELGDGPQTFQVDDKFNAFGNSAPSYSIEVTDRPVRGVIYVRPEGSQMPVIVRASDEQYRRGKMGARLAGAQDLESINELVKDAYPCLDRFQATSAFVATFTCARSSSRQRDTFQFMLISTKFNMYVLINYAAMQDYDIQNPLDQFSIEYNGVTYPLTMGVGPSEAVNLLQASNGARRGQWIIDITEATPQTPERCPKSPDTCTVTTQGSLQSFDGAFMLTPLGQKFLLARSLVPGDAAGPCDFQLSAVTNKIGEIRWVSMSVGAYTSRNIKHAINYAFDRKIGLMEKRGPGDKDIVVQTPVRWDSDDNATRIRIIGNVNNGWTLSSSTCPYKMIYDPNGAEPVLRLELGADFVDKMEGSCGNYNGLAADDQL